MNALVFLDTSARKHAIRDRESLRIIRGTTAYEFFTQDSASGVDHKLKSEIDLLPRVAALARAGRIKLITSPELIVELLGTFTIPNAGSSVFDGIAIESVDGPVEYSRILGGWFGDRLGSAKELQVAFLRSLQADRFIELQRACGAYQGRTLNENQLVDAFHIWCAEHAGATHFLTTDFKLGNVTKTFKGAPLKVKIVKPSELLLELGEGEVEQIT